MDEGTKERLGAGDTGRATIMMGIYRERGGVPCTASANLPTVKIQKSEQINDSEPIGIPRERLLSIAFIGGGLSTICFVIAAGLKSCTP